MGGITKSLAELFNTATPGTPGATDLLVFAPVPVTDFVTELKQCTVAELIAGGAAVVGPGVAVSNDIALFDGTTGKLIKDSGVPVVLLGGTLGSGGNLVIFGSALPALTSGQFNFGIGRAALVRLTSGDSNIAIGADALSFVTAGGGNVAVGRNALVLLTIGERNTAVGAGAGADSTGSRHVMIGYDAHALNPASDDQITIGTGAGGYFMRGDIALVALTPTVKGLGGFQSSDGSAGINTTVTTASLIGKTITIKNGLITDFS